uniref:ORF79b n=1 Tax=Pinus koraiensis TaxID=88728 RepID=A4QM88_PINKO|nr:ORF79b [Pinus koraiensis]ABP35425.1 ORF79b [Pinus koraiensis]
MERATGLSLHRTKLAKGVRSWAHARVSISSCQYPRQEIRNINPVAQTRCPNKNIHAQTDKLFIPKGLYPLISCEEFNHR